MGAVRYSPRAEDDLYDIAIYTLDHWGIAQADLYIAGLEHFCDLLADSPRLGRPCHAIAPSLRRIEHQSHIIFFFPTDDGILISRILYKGRDITDHAFAPSG
ncbi:type II toxin-antitoxin system RelE/ParE family toxin [Granulicella paludicola]|uniref:type II toxin-antitoxin system RelE/ParE family toxin n=1 Tax=Granulicella paludicola TaxID=474951 RepID=UPI0021DF7A1D|nr:type II toxin-antitoxin system RelE/ParE family toxin [Granulicella paludicola]